MSKTAPSNLGAQARKLWKGVTDVYELRSDELRILEDACREVDLIERLEDGLRGADLIVPGSMKQPTANPLIQEVRQHRATLKSLLGALKLPEDEARPASDRSASARKAAEARWRRGA